MTIVSPAGWLQNVGPTNSAQHMRNYVGSMLPYIEGSTIPVGGVNLSSGSKLAVVATDPVSMNVQVSSGVGWIPGSESGVQGAYAFMNDGTLLVAIDAAHATFPRYDVIVARVRDTQYSGIVDNVTIEVVKGTASGSAVIPALPANCLPLATVLLGAGQTSIANTDIYDMRWWLGPTYVSRKTVDETVSNLATIQRDDHLRIPLTRPNTFYSIDGYLFYDTSTTADIKLQIAVPAGAEARYTIHGTATSVTTTSGVGEFGSGFHGTPVSLGGRGVGSWLGAHITGVVRSPVTISTGSNLGYLELWWSQDVAEVSNTRITTNSWLRGTLITAL